MRKTLLIALFFFVLAQAYAQRYPVVFEDYSTDAVGEVFAKELLKRVNESSHFKLVPEETPPLCFTIEITTIDSALRTEDFGEQTAFSVVLLGRINRQPKMYVWSTVGIVPKHTEEDASVGLIKMLEEMLVRATF